MDESQKLLIIDDYKDLLLSMKEHFKLDGYSVDTAPDGETALKMCSEEPYAVALVDIMLPDIHGDELVLKMRSLIPDMDCIIMTGNATIESAVNSVGKEGIISYEIKPVDLSRMSSLIREVMGRKKAESQLKESEVYYRSIIEETSYGVCIIRRNRIVFANAEFRRITGIQDNEVHGNEEQPESEYQGYDDSLQIIDDLNIDGGSKEFTTRVEKKGGIIDVRVSVSEDIILGGKESIIVFIEDISEREKMRRQILRSEKNNLIAQLSMSLHHEIKNPLAIISGHAQTLIENPALMNVCDDEIEYSLEVIEKQESYRLAIPAFLPFLPLF